MRKVLYIFIFIATFAGCKKNKLNPDFVCHGNLVSALPAKVHFSNLTTEGTEFTWDFGDRSAPSHERNPDHIYTQEQTYTVTLTVSSSTRREQQISKDIAVTYIINAPTISFAHGDSTTQKELSTFTLNATFQSDNHTTLKNVNITQKVGNSGTFIPFDNTNLTGSSFVYHKNVSVPVGEPQIIYAFDLMDEKGNTTHKYYTLYITTFSGSWGPIDSIKGILGNQFNPQGPCWSVSLADKFDIARAQDIKAEIDFVFGHRSIADGGAFIAAPISQDVKEIYTSIASWNILNNTRFKLTNLSPTQYAQCHNDSVILYQTLNGLVNTSYKTIKPNDVVAFITAAGKRGLIYIKSLTGDLENKKQGTILFGYKVQK